MQPEPSQNPAKPHSPGGGPRRSSCAYAAGTYRLGISPMPRACRASSNAPGRSNPNTSRGDPINSPGSGPSDRHSSQSPEDQVATPVPANPPGIETRAGRIGPSCVPIRDNSGKGAPSFALGEGRRSRLVGVGGLTGRRMAYDTPYPYLVFCYTHSLVRRIRVERRPVFRPKYRSSAKDSPPRLAREPRRAAILMKTFYATAAGTSRLPQTYCPVSSHAVGT